MVSRLQKLTFLLKQQNQIHLREAAEILGVSEMTIRRDINSGSTPFNLLGGYIVLKKQKSSYQVIEQQSKHTTEKLILGEEAAKLIEEDDVVFFDCGSTIPFIASQIDPKIRFTAICCSLNTFLVLSENSNCRLILLGGEFSRNNVLFNPLNNESELDFIITDKAFISAAGFSDKNGATCFDFTEAKIKRKAILKSKQAILVVDKSKKEVTHNAFICSLSEFSRIITDI
ncbi:DNA-binding transcriptional repressor DeoR [Ursidibacter maritimus]|uniref:DNA-binding transcriptional repressor DeoR n=1 Tax=Ursidibacter maritimus TaxID=1331689 RepID=A0A949WH19_9PAST|nr:DNA-binding transcriptional repressor DeoR [Ursidibacter maritimus]KAE9541480.1 transcriptional regulator [Ursidibacter maritimus]MBV6524836.1 DNA-binding transcriptional repressor DeoR [Ursidibacter maritimus]MBV6526743.1 DNA-binding transcriptional repressor DeoR [Ursidibacter maritimus]MBV6528594.1 DNA-binding transcriptional repressor DeoR [Ursidibacter maritimus]MBV6530443.1 DNA-binding transcriptional repressor DeoR [Ursidibacter maritimus]